MGGKLEKLVATYGASEVEALLWAYAHEMEDAGTVAVVEAALAEGGVDGIRDLVLAGRAHGGLDARDVEPLLAFAEAWLLLSADIAA